MAIVLFCSFSPVAAASSITDLQNQKAALEQRIKSEQAAQQQKQSEQAQFQKQLNNLANQMAQVQQYIHDTTTSISDTQAAIAQKNADIADKQQQIKKERANQAETIREIYETGGTSFLEVFVNSQNLSDVLVYHDYLDALQQKIQGAIDVIQGITNQLEKDKADLENKQASLIDLQHQQQVYQEALDAQQQQQSQLLAAAKAAEQNLANNEQDLAQKITVIEQRLKVLTETANWGTDIVSDAPASWSYIQLDYPGHLGASPYTIHDYGCLVTSLAMVARSFGHSVTPNSIASNPIFFDGQGNAYVSSIAQAIGITIAGSGAVNWNVVDQELAAGKPVIVSIYLPQVGAINSDGSSHYIVISAKAGNHYLMQDPLGTGRGYSAGQVRSMLIVS